MNKINPFVLLGIFIFVFLIVFYKVQNAQNLLEQNTKNLANIQENAQKILDLKQMWENKNTDSKLRYIFENKANFEKKSNKLNIQAQNLQSSFAQKAIEQLLNEPVKLQKLHITRLNDQNISLNLEIQEWNFLKKYLFLFLFYISS